MQRNLTNVLLMVGGGLLLLPAKGAASLFEAVSDVQLVCEATDVVHGQVTEVQSAWDEEHRAIWTTATVQVHEAIRGQKAKDEVIQVKEVGGTVGDYTIQAEGFPTFQEGEEVVLLLRPWEDDPGTYRVWGYGRGLFAVVRPRGRAPVSYRHDVAESGQPTMFMDRLPAVASLQVLNRELGALARECERGGRP